MLTQDTVDTGVLLLKKHGPAKPNSVIKLILIVHWLVQTPPRFWRLSRSIF